MVAWRLFVFMVSSQFCEVGLSAIEASRIAFPLSSVKPTELVEG